MAIQHPSFAKVSDCARIEPSSALQTVWVKLKASPSPYSFSEAMLLCNVSEDEWLAWVPDFGEIQLTTAQFVVD